MIETEKWKRLTNPKTVADWGVGVSFEKLMLENPELVIKEILPDLRLIVPKKEDMSLDS